MLTMVGILTYIRSHTWIKKKNPNLSIMILRTFYLSSQKQEAHNVVKTKILEYQIR